MSEFESQHTDLCDDFCNFESDGFHTSRSTIASKGGPMEESEPDHHVDLAPSISLRRFHDGTADVRMVTNIWTRMGHSSTGWNWGVHGELFDFLPPVPMSSTRARYLAKLLVEAADEADKLNDQTGTPDELWLARLRRADRDEQPGGGS